MRNTVSIGVIVTSLAMMLWAQAEEPPLTRNVPIPEFQNRLEDLKPYNFDAPPEGIFRSIQVAAGFEEEVGFRRQYEIIPVAPGTEFPADAPVVYIVFALQQHYQSFQVFGICYGENISGMDSLTIVARDAMHIALEDESGYLKLLAPEGGWKPGHYKVEIHVGEQINELSLIGTMRFNIISSSSSGPSSSGAQIHTP